MVSRFDRVAAFQRVNGQGAGVDGTANAQSGMAPNSCIKALDGFGGGLALSSDSTTLAIGAYREGSSAKGIGGSPTSDLAKDSGAVYVY